MGVLSDRPHLFTENYTNKNVFSFAFIRSPKAFRTLLQSIKHLTVWAVEANGIGLAQKSVHTMSTDLQLVKNS